MIKWRGLPLVIFGSGGISKEVFNLVKQINKYNSQPIYEFIGFVDDEPSKIGLEVIGGYKVIASDLDILEFCKQFPVIGVVIPIGNPKVKANIFEKVKSLENAVYPNIIYPKSSIDFDHIELGVGNIITEGVVFTCDIKVGNFNLFNLNTTVGHDTIIGDFNVINPLVAVSGNVNIGKCCLIGTGSQVLQQLTVEDFVTVGAGAVVVKNVKENSTVVGIPAKPIQ